MKAQPEYELQVLICSYIARKYPKALFMSDTIAAVRLTMPQAVRNKKVQKSGFKCPDIIVFEPCGGFCGLFLELKVETPYKKDGTLKKDAHVEAQHKTICDLRERGYHADFYWTYEAATEAIDRYFKSNAR